MKVAIYWQRQHELFLLLAHIYLVYSKTSNIKTNRNTTSKLKIQILSEQSSETLIIPFICLYMDLSSSD